LICHLYPVRLNQVQPEARLRGAGVFFNVIQRFLDDAKETLFFYRPQRSIAFYFQRNR
jgi:hypothetical protein